MLCRLLFVCFVFFAGLAQAGEPPSRQLAQELLALTGTAAVFDSPKVQAALADPEPFLGDSALPRRERLLEESGLKRWRPPHVWILQSHQEGEVVHWDNVASQFKSAAQERGYGLVEAPPLPGAEEAIAFLVPGKAHAGLPVLLAAYGADALMLLRGHEWSLWTDKGAEQGALPASPGLLAEVLAEKLSAIQQWPEAQGRAVVQVSGVNGFADFAAVQAALRALPGAQQVQLIRSEAKSVWFALAAPVGEPLTAALDGEPRLPAQPRAMTPLSAQTGDARRLACPLQLRYWKPEAAPKPSAASVQSPSF